MQSHTQNKTCPQCYQVFSAHLYHCPKCNYYYANPSAPQPGRQPPLPPQQPPSPLPWSNSNYDSITEAILHLRGFLKIISICLVILASIAVYSLFRVSIFEYENQQRFGALQQQLNPPASQPVQNDSPLWVDPSPPRYRAPQGYPAPRRPER